MNTKIFSLFLTLAGVAGCAIGPRGRGDVLFIWSFGGLNCSQVPVTSVVINIPGERLENDGVYPCSIDGVPGIILRDFLAGNYSFTISARDAANAVLYQTSSSFQVYGDTRVVVDLSPSGELNSSAYLSWSFPANGMIANPTCAQAGDPRYGIAFVDVQIDRGRVQRYRCEDGQVPPGVLAALLPGRHEISLNALPSSGGYPYYSTLGTLDTVAGTIVSASYTLQWAVGGVAVRWQFAPGQSCSSTGISTVNVNFTDAAGISLYPAPGDPQPCSAGTSVPISYDFLPAATYTVQAQATGTLRAYVAAVPGVTINPGQFSNPAQPVTLTLNSP
jgi:hypothetical protein